MLDSPLAWVVSSITQPPPTTYWIVLDAGTIKLVQGVVTQGRHDQDEAPAAYMVQHSIDGSTFIDTNQGEFYTGNTDRDTKVYNLFPTAVNARYIRISGTFTAMRCDILIDRYLPTVGTSSCTACPTGYTTLSSGTPDGGVPCKLCAAGYSGRSVVGFSGCNICPIGTYSASGNWTKCVACPIGRTTESTGTAGTDAAAACNICSDGYQYTVADNESASCTACPLGKYALSGKPCTGCKAGSYMPANSINSGICVLCEAGKYSSTDNASVCIDCAVGKYLDRLGGVGGSCLKCMPGYFSAVVGAISCRKCPVGSYSRVNFSECLICNAGFYAFAGSSKCNHCIAGSYSAENGAGKCLPCPAGRFSYSTASECTACRAGTHSSMHAAQCLECPAGKTSVAAAETCIACANGEVSEEGEQVCHSLEA